jgi:multidrug efflux pump subunit AcrA (membrane-fusion protein)
MPNGSNAAGLLQVSTSLLALALLVAGAAHAAMYRWVDSNGRVHYSDTLPPTYQKSGAAEMNKQGTVIKRTQSEAERRAEAERQAELARVRAEQAKQAQLDRALTQTYTSEAEIDLARDRALEHHRLLIKSSQIRAEAVNATLAELKDRMARIEKNGRKVGPGLVEQYEQAERESLELKRTILNNEEALVRVRDKYTADKLRFRELTANKP